MIRRLQQLVFRTPRRSKPFHSADALAEVLRNEQLRSERSGRTFSLLVMRFPDPAALLRDRDFLEAIVAERLRATDQAGILDHDQLGVVLPYAEGAGAWKVADCLCELITERLPRPTCQVFTYPESPTGTSVNESGPATAPRTQLDETLSQRESSGRLRYEQALDLCGTALALAIVSPVMLAAAVAVKFTSPGPILFRQRHEGQFGRPFVMYKLRSMHERAEKMQEALRPLGDQDSAAFKLFDDPRLTPVGRFLRSTSIDELPQLFNVLRREMSLVGPRPLPISESRRCRPWRRRRLEVWPGLTWVWQVRGRSRVSFDEWMRMDLQYLSTRTLKTDLALLLLTVPAVLSRDGAR